MGYEFERELFAGVLSGVFAMVPSSLLAIASYVLTSLALYTIASRRGLNNPWLAWVPVANSWLVGSVSDQYRYVVRRERKSKRKVLLILSVVNAVLSAVMFILTIVMIGHAISGVMMDHSEEYIVKSIMGPVMSILGLCLPVCAVAIAYAILRYMALYDIYRSLDPSNSTLYLVLSILMGVTTPFFLFFNRNKDDGMPPRKRPEQSGPAQDGRSAQNFQTNQQLPDTSWQPTPDRPDPWNQGEPENKDYL